MSLFERERTSAETVPYALYFYFPRLSLRDTARAIQPFGDDEGRSHVAVWKWVQDLFPDVLTVVKEYLPF
jgi:hypothetical protein